MTQFVAARGSRAHRLSRACERKAPVNGVLRRTSGALAMKLAAASVALGLSTGAAPTAHAQEVIKTPSATASAQLPRGFAGAYLAARRAAEDTDYQSAAYYFRRAYRSDPSNMAIGRSALTYSVTIGDVASAAPLAAAMLSRGAGLNNAALILSVDAISKGLWDEAGALLSQSSFPPLVRDLVLGWIAYGAGDGEAAYGHFLANLDEAGKETLGNEQAGHLAMLEGDPARAAQYYEASAAALGGWTPATAIAAAGAYQAAGDQDAAERVIAAAIEAAAMEDETLFAARDAIAGGKTLAPMVDSAQTGAGLALVSIGRSLGDERRDQTELGVIFAQLGRSLAPELDQASLLAGDRLYSIGLYDLATEAYEEVRADSFFIDDARFGAAIATGAGGDEATALAQLSKLAAADAQGPRVYLALGLFAASQKEYAVCADAYETGLGWIEGRVGALDRRHWTYEFQAGVCRARNDEWDAAETHFQAALALWPDQPDVLNYFGYSLVEKRERYDEARVMIERAVEQKPRSGHIIDSLGWVMWRTGDFDGAVRELARAVAIEPNVYEINDHYGDALWMVGRKREARYHWERALLFVPEDEPAVAERIEQKLEVGLDAVLAAENDAPPAVIEESAAPSGQSDALRPNGG